MKNADTWVLFEVLLKVVAVAILVLDVAGVGRGVVGDEEEVEDDEGHVKDEQGPRELGLGREIRYRAGRK